MKKAIVIVLVMLLAGPVFCEEKIHPLIQNDIRFKIDTLFLKHDIKSSQCKTALLKFYYHQNSDPVLDGDMPWYPITVKDIKNIAQKHNCPVKDLAGVVTDYEAWVNAEESVNRNAYEDYGGGAEFDYDQFQKKPPNTGFINSSKVTPLFMF